jgi:hypothetical protein
MVSLVDGSQYLAWRHNVACANLFRRLHEEDTVVAESFEKKHADMFVWQTEHKLNNFYHIWYIPIVASLAFIARLWENLTPIQYFFLSSV